MEKETLEEAAANLADPNLCKTDNWIAGAEWQAKKMYSEEMLKVAQQAILCNIKDALQDENYIIEYLKQFNTI